MTDVPADEPILRAKYLDWCSARVAERFLRLTPDEIYDLAQQAAPAPSTPAGVPAAPAESSPQEGGAGVPVEADAAGSDRPLGLSYRALVERVTEVLTVHLGLPPFEEWLVAYRADPDRFDADLLGFWKDGG